MANNYKVKIVDLQNKYKFKIFAISSNTVMKNEIDALYQAWPKESGTGTSVNLTGVIAAPMNIDLKGNGGKNILDMSSMVETQTKNGVTFTNNGNGTFNISGTATANVSFSLVPGSILSDKIESGVSYYLYSSQPYDANTFNISVQAKLDGTTRYYTPTNTPRSYTFSTKESVSCSVFVANGQTVNATNAKIMLVKSTTVDNDYEPYGASVTGNNTIDICGKNLFGFNLSAIDKTSTYRPTFSQQLIITGTDNPNEVKFNYNYGPYSRGYFEINGIDGTLNYNISFNIKEKTSSYNPTATIDTTNSTTKKLVFYINGGNGSTNVSRDEYFILNNIQVEKGSTATTYEPYQGANYPINLGSTKLKTDDSIQGSKNNWYIERADGTIEPIADTTLISQLNNLRYNAESYEGTTNISQVNSDMPFIFTASAIKDLSNL